MCKLFLLLFGLVGLFNSKCYAENAVTEYPEHQAAKESTTVGHSHNYGGYYSTSGSTHSLFTPSSTFQSFFSASLAPTANTPYPCMYGICNGTCCGEENLVEDYFDCSNGQKINRTLVCNRKNDCDDGSDESKCSPWPPKITVLPKQEVRVFCGDREKEKSGTLILECRSVGHPTPLIRWRKYEGHVPSKCTQYSKRGHGILTCPNFQQSDQGAYSCVAENSVKLAESQPKSIAKCSNTINCRGFRIVNEEQIEHCIDCYCSGKTSQCQGIKSNPTVKTFTFPSTETEIFAAENGDILFIPTTTELTPKPQIRKLAHEITYCTLTKSEIEESALLKSFGRSIIIPRYKGKTDFLTKAPDLIIRGNGISLMYTASLISPSKDGQTYTSARLWPGNWHHINKLPASREDLMKVLSNTDTLFIRCEYQEGKTTTWDRNITISVESSVITNIGASISYVEKCSCPTGYEGLSCESCAPGYKKKIQGNDFLCEKIYVPPVCSEGYIGVGCKYCDVEKGYIKKGESCIKPVCHSGGSVSPKLNLLGSCTCKVGVKGDYCEECASGYFYLSQTGCQKCWCSGITNQCKSSSLYKTVISSIPRGGYNSSDGRNFWLLPSDFSGNRLTSYGGYLNYTMKYKQNIPKQNTQLTVEFLSVDDVTLVFTHPQIDKSKTNADKSWSVPIVESMWKKSDKSSVSRSEFLTVLSKIKAVYIESPYHLSSGQVNLTSARMDSATSANIDTDLALSVEQCNCPVGYTGLSCETCSSGYYKKRNGTITECIQCNCSNCDPEFGCPACPELTYRDNPEHEKMPVCKPCPCNGNGISCVKDDHNQIFCLCKSGFSGMHCENTMPKEINDLTVSISPRKIKSVKAGTSVFVNCSFSSNEEMVLSVRKSYSTVKENSLAGNHSRVVAIQGRNMTKSFEVVIENGLEAFECLVHDARGKLAGHVIAVVEDLIKFIKPVKITNCHSDRIDIKESESKEIICEASGFPTPVISWYRLKSGETSEKVDSSEGVYSIVSASLNDNGTVYTCIAENSDGDKATCTQVLIVQKKCEVIKIFPSEVKVEENRNVSIQCKTTAKNPVVWWKYDPVFGTKSIFSFRIKESNGFLHITDTQVSDSGTYICSAVGENGTINKTVSVTVEVKKIPPAVTIHEYDKVLKVGESFQVTCLGSGKPEPVLVWTKLNDKLSSNVYTYGKLLKINQAIPENSGVYQCEGKSSLGRATAYISITVENIKLPPVVNISETDIKAHHGDEINLTCLAIGYPRPQLTWFTPNITYMSTSRVNNSMVLISPQESLKEEIRFKVTKEMDGVFIHCIAQNEAGESVAKAVIKVLQSQGGINETVKFVPIGSYFEVQCDFTEDLKCEKSGGLVGDECPIPNGLMIKSVQSQHNGTYICKSSSVTKKIINLIVVGFVPKFSSAMKSFLVLPVEWNSSQNLRIEMTFNATSENGWLLRKYNGHFGVYLEKSKVHLSIHSKHKNYTHVKMNSPIELNKWFSLVVIINENYVDITIYNEETNIHERKTDQSHNFGIELGDEHDNFFVGGFANQINPMRSSFRHKFLPHFDGCISRLTINRHEYDVVKESSYSQNVGLCKRCSEEPNLCHKKGKCLDAPTQYGFICVCPGDRKNKNDCANSCAKKGCETQLDLCGLLKPCSGAFFNTCNNHQYTLECNCAPGFSGTTCEKVQEYSFCANGNGFVKLPSYLLERRVGAPETIRMAFTLQKPNGQLLWQGDKLNYLSIAVADKKLGYTYANQNTSLSVYANGKLEMNEKYTLYVQRINGSVILEIAEADAKTENSKTYKNSINKYYTNRVSGDIYLGNLPNNTLKTDHAVGLQGCIHYVSFGDKSKINLPEKQLEYYNVFKKQSSYYFVYGEEDDSDQFNYLDYSSSE